MNKAEQLYVEIGESIAGAKTGNMFGWKCFKYQNKPFLFFDKNSHEAMVFKLDKDAVPDALRLEGAATFNPGNKGAPMKNWAVVPFRHRSLWKELALKAFEEICNEVKNGKR
jgi:hypothetical protein